MSTSTDTAPTAARLPPQAAFIVGLKRSGTSLLKSLLDGHPDLWVVPRETKTFHWRHLKDPVDGLLKKTRYGERFPSGTPEGEAFEAACRRRLSGPCDASHAILSVAEAVTEVAPPPASARIWMEKTPDHLLHVDELVRVFGDQTRFVCTLRDPRGQIASRARRRQPGEHFPIPRFAYKWALGDGLIQRYADSYPQFLVVRYEDLVLDTQATIEKVAAHLGIPWNDCLLHPMREGDDWEGNSSYGDKPKGISEGSLTRWKKQLDAEQIAGIETLLGPRMRARGYELEAPRGGAPVRRWFMERRAAAAAEKLRRG